MAGSSAAADSARRDVPVRRTKRPASPAIRSTAVARVSAEKALFYQVSVSAALLPLLSLGLGETWTWHWSAFAIGSLLLQTGVGAFSSYLAWMWLLVHYPATKISAFVFLTPIFALVFGSSTKVWPGAILSGLPSSRVNWKTSLTLPFDQVPFTYLPPLA